MIAARQIFLGRGGAKLPYDAEVEYLESTGTQQWIDTGCKYKSTYSIRLNYTRVGQGTNGSVVASTSITAPLLYFPALNVNAKTDRFILRRSGYSEQLLRYDFDSYPYTAEVYLDAQDDVLYINNEAKKTGMIAGMGGYGSPYESASNIYLFSIAGSFGGLSRIYRFCIEENGIKKLDLTPVRFTNERGVSEGAMYDRVSKQLFRNQGTGSFVLGPDVVPVEYIESTGAKYIDTQFKANTGTTSFEISLTQKNINQYPQGLFGSRNTASAANSSFNAFMMSGGVVRADFVGSARNLNSGMTDNSLFVIRYDNRKVYVNGVSDILSYAENSTLQNYNFLVGSFTNGSDTPYSNGFIGLIHYVKLWSSGVLVRDLIPVRVGSGSIWEGAMMDTLTRRIYRNSNSGTGAFSYGPDK